MAQVSNANQIDVRSTRPLTIGSMLPMLVAGVMLIGALLPQTSNVLENTSISNTSILILALIAVGVGLWTLYDVRARFVGALLLTIIGIVVIISLFNLLAALSTATAVDGEPAHVGVGFWLSLIGAFGLIVQLFTPRPALNGVQGYGEAGLRDFMARMGVLGELLSFMWKRKLYWLIPMVLTLAVFAVIIVAGSSSAIAPFIYALW